MSRIDKRFEFCFNNNTRSVNYLLIQNSCVVIIFQYYFLTYWYKGYNIIILYFIVVINI